MNRNYYVSYNANPISQRVGDCTVRAISKATGKDWHEIYVNLCLQGFMMCDMPSANAVWGAYLRSIGFRRNLIPDECHDYYCVADFCEDHPSGRYILALSGHVVPVIDGKYYDTWDSGGEIPLYYWEKLED